MPTRSTRKVNIYKWHRMKKKLISSVISVLCCLVVMAVGVYASTSHAFEVTISNDIDVKIIAVDGDLYARRRGGVYATPTGSESAYGNAVTPATYFEDPTATPDKLIKIYDKEMNIDDLKMQDLCRKIDINVYNNEIEYVFKYVIEEGSLFTTKLSIVNGPNGTIKPGLDERVECSYKYCFSTTEPDWSKITNVFNVDAADNHIEVYDATDKRCVYIRAYLKYKTEEYGKELSKNSAEAQKGLGFKGKWQFSLQLEEAEFSTK